VDVDVLVVASSTGFSVPTLDHHLASVLGLRREARCLFLSGLGCTGAVRALGLAGDLLAANPLARHGLVVSVELCSPWLQVQEPSPEDVLANILFGDGAGAAVIGASGGARGLEVVASRVETWPESLDARGARLTQSGFRHFASPRLPRLLRLHLRRCVEEFLGEHGLTPRDLGFHIANPSDHRVLETIASVLELPDAQTRPAWTSWEEHGNTLSAGPLYVLDALRRERLPVAGDLGLAIVLGPGLTCDLTLLRCHSDLAG
jgi:alkylresorcinol/alkylpyrone synthase